ncbi:MAG: PilC/PilY family type IV pilus protein, partial [Hydrogenophaga sp.]|nr:PilC/PilY family type IV pilus protein [Hydrogenophaga sp.]
NVSPGTGRGFLFVLDALTGAVLHKIATGEGTTTTPSGLGKVADFVTSPDVDNTVLLAYAGDLLGNLWRFDLATNTAVKQAELTDASGTSQPITARPETGQCGDRKMVFVGTGKYLGASDVETTQLQTMWGIRDSSTALGVLRGSDTMVQQTLSGSGSTYTVSNNPVNLAEKNGWYVNFDRNSGERVNLDPLLVNKNLLVLTNQPVSDGSAACGTGGKGFLYQFSYCTGSYLASPNAPQVGEHISDSIVVGFTPIGLPSGTVPVKVITAEGIKLPPIPITQEGGAGGAMRRISWRELID